MSVMVAERQFDGAETGDSPVVKVKGSITKLVSRLLEGSSSRASWETYCAEDDLETDIAKHIIEEYTELQKFESQEATVLIVGGGVDRMTELEHFFSQMKLMIIDFLPRCLRSLSEGTADFCSELASRSSGRRLNFQVCTGVKATNCFMPKKTLSEKGLDGGGWIVVNKYLQVETRDGPVL